MTERATQPGYVGCFFMRCKIHGTPFSVFYGGVQLRDRETALRRIEEFRQTHCIYSPDCGFDARIDEELESAK